MLLVFKIIFYLQSLLIAHGYIYKLTNIVLILFFQEFIQKTKTIAWWALILTVVLTELHIDQIRSLFTALATS